MCTETYLKMEKAREAIVEVCKSLHMKNMESDDSMPDIEARMVYLLREYENIVGDYVIREEE